MADRTTQNRYNRQDAPWRDRDERNWRQQEQFSPGQPEWAYNDYDYGQMNETYGRTDTGQRQSDYETGWDRNSRYGQRGTGYARQNRNYGEGEYNYGPARYDTPGHRFGSFTSEDQGGRDFTAPTTTGYAGYPGYGGYSGYGGYGYGGYPGYPGYAGYGAYGAGDLAYGYGGAHYGERTRGGMGANRRGWFERAGDEVASWFGDEDAARRRAMDHRGRGPANYTRSDDRIREDVNDSLTDDWAVDARKITVTVANGEVTLDGTVSTRLQKRRAEDCAEDVSGVKHVQNNLRVQEASSWDRNEPSESKATTRTG